MSVINRIHGYDLRIGNKFYFNVKFNEMQFLRRLYRTEKRILIIDEAIPKPNFKSNEVHNFYEYLKERSSKNGNN